LNIFFKRNIGQLEEHDRTPTWNQFGHERIFTCGAQKQQQKRKQKWDGVRGPGENLPKRPTLPFYIFFKKRNYSSTFTFQLILFDLLTSIYSLKNFI